MYRMSGMVLVIFFTALVLSCTKPAVSQDGEAARFASFRDIPGVTKEEIEAIEAIRKEYSSFVYGMTKSTESFVDSFSESGEIKGYSARFCDWMTELFGIPFKITLYNWGDLLAGLNSGKVDFTGDLMATEERHKIYFMTSPIAQRSLMSFQIKGNPSITEIAESRPPRLAFLSASAVLDKVSEVVEYDFETVFVNDTLSAYDLMKNGMADAFLVMGISEATFDGLGDLTGEIFLPLVYNSASMSTINPKLAPIISVVEKALLHHSTRLYLLGLYDTGYHDYCVNKLFAQLTGEERAYMRNPPVIHVGIDPGNYPGSFYDRREKEWRGIFPDILRELSSLTGLTFKNMSDEHTAWPSIYHMLVNGEVAMVGELTQAAEREGQFLWPHIAQMTDYYALISKSTFPNIKINEMLYYRVGMAQNTSYTDIFSKWFPDHTNTVLYISMDEAFAALQNGEVDMVMATQKRLLYLTNYLELPDYKLNILFDQPINIKFGLNRNEAILCSIIDKALGMIDTKAISDQWIHKTYDYNSKLVEAQMPWLVGSSALLMCVLTLVAFLFTKSRRTGIKLEEIVKQRTHDLNLQTSMFMTIFNSSPDFIFCKDLNLQYMRCNKSMRNFLNISDEEIIGKNDWEIFGFSPEVAEGYIREDQKVIRGKRPIVFEEMIVSQSDGGKKLIVETIKTPLVQDDEVIGIMGISRDITERKKVEREFALQTATLTTLFDSIPDIIFTKDLDLCFMQCNKSLTEHYGIHREDIIGKNYRDGLGMPEDIAMKNDEMDCKVIKEGLTIVIEEHLPRVDGMNPLYETIKTPLKLDGIVIGLLGISRDITKRKEMEDVALSASRSKSAFLANMSHEIRTPMNSIVGFSELAMDGEASTKTKDYLAKILENAEWLLQIINDILDISKIESGKMELENISFSIQDLFGSCRTLVMPKAIEKGINLYCYAEPSVGRKPLGDPTRLRQVLVNLLSNAVKFTNTGMVKLHAAIMNKRNTSITVLFEVRDSGIGMTPEQIEKIFDPFMQAETGTTRKYGGTGLGLAITKNIVELMGGTLIVESTPGLGSKFSFSLTFNTVDVSNEEMFEKKMLLNELEKPAFEGEILLCEDNVMNQQVICEHLARVGLVTVVAENGKIGVEMVQNRKEKHEKQFDLIFMDMHMPVMDGLEAAAKILEFNTGIPIVAMTANIMSNDREIYRMNGIDDCVGKPFSSQELWRCLMKYFTPVSGGVSQKKDQLQADMEFMRSLQVLFVKSNQNKYEEIVNALDAGDIKLAHRLAHTLKSNAGQLNKVLLQKAAAAIEMQLKDGENLVTTDQLKVFETELNVVLHEFTPLLQEAHNQSEESRISITDPKKILEVFEKLEDLLKSGNPECMGLISAIRAIPESDDLKTRLIQQIEDFEFDEALSILAGMKENRR